MDFHKRMQRENVIECAMVKGQEDSVGKGMMAESFQKKENRKDYKRIQTGSCL